MSFVFWPYVTRAPRSFSGAKALATCMSVFFVMGWCIFPFAWTLAPTGVGIITNEQAEICYAIGDILAKNIFALCGVLIKHHYLQVPAAPLPAAWPQAGRCARCHLL